MKIAIITCHSPYNYGAVLQCYALSQCIKNLNHESIIIDYQTPKIEQSKSYTVVRNIVRKIDFIKCNKVFSKFLKDHIHTTEPYASYNELEMNPPTADAYIAGSDQIWNMKLKNGWDDSYYLEFVPKGKNIISYAASCGDSNFNEGEIAHLKLKLSKFNALSVREKKTAEVLRTQGFKDIKTVLDPALLLTKEDWTKFCQETKEKNEPYVLVYSFYRQKALYTYARALANKNSAKVYVISTLWSDIRFDSDYLKWVPTIQEFVSLFANAQSVVTNSYHGLIFSLLFEKPFHIFDSITGMDRIDDLLERLAIKKRITGNNYGELLSENLDWIVIRSRLELLRQESLNYLSKAIEGNSDVN